MYDTMLKNDLLALNRGLYNIDDIQYNREEMKKVIFCRTQDKIWLIKQLLNGNEINPDYYDELYNRIKSDFNKANLYLLGWCKI